MQGERRLLRGGGKRMSVGSGESCFMRDAYCLWTFIYGDSAVSSCR